MAFDHAYETTDAPSYMQYVHEVLSGARYFALENSTVEYLSFNPVLG